MAQEQGKQGKFESNSAKPPLHPSWEDSEGMGGRGEKTGFHISGAAEDDT